MKKILLACMVVCCLSAGAQTTTLGIKAGVASSALVTKIDSEDGDQKSTLASDRIGFTIGALADIKFNPNFSIQPNVIFTIRNSYFIEAGDYKGMSIDVPINFLYHHNNFFVGLGPNFSYGLSAKTSPPGSNDEEDENDFYEDVEEEGAPFKRFEIGANLLLGYKFPSGLTLSANYTRGLSNVLDTDLFSGYDVKINHRLLGFSIGYNF